MRLSEFIRTNTKDITSEWESFAKTMTPAANSMSQLQLRDHIVEILTFIADDIELTQSDLEQIQKSHGESDNPIEYKDSAAEIHGSLRHEDGFNIVQMVSEYRALRASIIKLWTKTKGVLNNEDVLDLTRCNECIDQALAESVVRFMDKVDYSKDLLLGVLGHDIRSPLGFISMAAQILPNIGKLNEKQTYLAAQMESSSNRVNKIVTDLLDLTRARMGTKLPIVKATMNLGDLADQIVNELIIQYPGKELKLLKDGNLKGIWDNTRLGQVLTNLLNNAIQYGENSSVTIDLKGLDNEVVISVHNKGEPIPQQKLKTIFNSFNRGDQSETSSANLGLGLYITREIVTSHGGIISVSSDQHEGTYFIIKLPK